jgi:NADH dehydrogenase
MTVIFTNDINKMNTSTKHAVTGAYGYSGSYIAHRLQSDGCRIITLTNSPSRSNRFGDKIEAYPFKFENPEELTETLHGVSVLYNTYWIRFNHRKFSHSKAVRNLKVLFNCAKDAGVERIVYSSIINPSLDSPYEYFSGKAEVEQALIETGLSYAVLRPAVLFGGKPEQSILINNIAWALRHLPAFGVFGDGSYKIQPIHVDDFAKLAVEQGKSRENVIINAIGSETFTYRELVETIAKIIGVRKPIISVSPSIGFMVGQIIGWLKNDVIITREEIESLMDGLLFVDDVPAGETKLTDWISENSNEIGIAYSNEISKR